MSSKLDKLESRLAAVESQRKELRGQISAEKRKAKAEAEKKQRLQEQAEALEFVRLCKVIKINEKPDAPCVYDWVMKRREKVEVKQ